MDDVIQIFTTTDDKMVAVKISHSLVGQRLAACVQILGPISSRCRWKGRIVSSSEWLVLAKTKRSHYKRAEAAIKRVHNYTLPEILAVPVIEGDPNYLKWLGSEVK